MKDEWVASVDIFTVSLTFDVCVEKGARLVEAECDCDSAECRHVRLAETKVRHVFADGDWEWDDERERLGLPREDVEVTEAPAQWRPLLDDGDSESADDSNTICLGSIWSAVR